ncbi:hypothetical protein V6N13_142386 [Hibiscus sabdariffa]
MDTAFSRESQDTNLTQKFVAHTWILEYTGCSSPIKAAWSSRPPVGVEVLHDRDDIKRTDIQVKVAWSTRPTVGGEILHDRDNIRRADSHVKKLHRATDLQ